MGGIATKENNNKKKISPELKNAFGLISSNKQEILKSELETHWACHLNSDFYTMLKDYLLNERVDKKITLDVFSKLYIDLIYGSPDYKSDILKNIITDHCKTKLTKPLVIHYVSNVIASLYNVLTNTKEYMSWSEKHCQIKGNQVKLLADAICNELPNEVLDSESFLQFISACPELPIIHQRIFKILYKIPLENEKTLLPLCENVPVKRLPSILDYNSILFLNMALPTEYTDRWRFLFSTGIHGESFSKLLGKIQNQGPTIIIIRDKSGYIFGGFASLSWAPGPKFTGDSTSFLFKLHPEMKIFPATNYNTNFQYLNLQQATLPNGLGMGGQFEYFGLWVDSEFGRGHSSESCTTFREYTMLSAEKNFLIEHVEVWAVGEPPETLEEKGERSILKGNEEVKALMELTGKKRYAEHFLELDEDNQDAA